MTHRRHDPVGMHLIVYFRRGHLRWVLVGAWQMRFAEPLEATPRPAASIGRHPPTV
ncbi:conserved hypothetical protein [Arthrobacter sp. 8AJ]|nr:conserved hypothetical protein [Arthrobacter sp. 8AJ]